MAIRLLSRQFSKLSSNNQLYTDLRTHFYALYEQVPCMPIMVRLGWHDAGTYDKSDGSGGPNGTLRFAAEQSHGANAGIGYAVERIEEAKQKFPQVSYADLMQAGSYAAVSFCKGPEIPFAFGRVDGSEADVVADGRLPDASQGVSHLREVFSRMGLNDVEIVALSGAHTLGKAHKDRSGYEGKWTPEEYIFDTSYFVELLQGKNPGLLRLPTDEALLKDTTFKYWVEYFARDKALFFQEYSKAYKKLSELGWE